MRRGHSLILLNLLVKSFLSLSQSFSLIGFIIIPRVPPINYAKRLHRPLASGRDVERTGANQPPLRNISNRALFSILRSSN